MEADNFRTYLHQNIQVAYLKKKRVIHIQFKNQVLFQDYPK